MSNHYRELLRLGVPIMIGQLGMIILSFADTLMIGHHSTIELGAAAFVNSMMNLFVIFSTGFSYGLTPIVGELFGHKDLKQVGLSLRCSLVANALIAFLVMAVLGVIYLNLDRLGQPEELLPYIRPYFLSLLVSMLFVLLFNAFRQFTDGITDTRTGMWMLLGGNLLNIIGNYLLIYGKCGFPELGLFGAGLSTLIARIMMLAGYVWLVLTAKRFKPYKEGLLHGQFSRNIFVRLNNLGWPVALQMGMETASFSLTAIMVGWLGTIALASHQVMLTISQFAFMIYYGLGAAIAVRVSNFRGMGDIANVRNTVYAGFRMMLLLELIIVAVMLPFYQQMGGWFADDAEVTAAVATLFIPFVFYQFGDGLQITFANALRGISDVKPMMLYAFLAYFVISLPVCYLLAFVLGLGLPGIWLSFLFGLTSAGVMFYLRFRKSTREC